MEATAGRIACECGKTYRWKPERAGQQGKCPCGAIIQFPAEPPVEIEEPIIEEDVPPPPPARRSNAAVSALSGKPAAKAPGAKGKMASVTGEPLNWRGAGWFLGGGVLMIVLGVAQILHPHDPSEDSGRRGIFDTVQEVAYKVGGQWGAVGACGLLSIGAFALGWAILTHRIKHDKH